MLCTLRTTGHFLCAARQSIPNISIRATRGYATLKDIQMRLKAIKNIEKITKSMKMIASTKLNRAQKAMELCRIYGESVNTIFPQLGLDSTKNIEEKADDSLVIVCSSDRGLCGSIHSSVSKAARHIARTASKETPTRIVVLGDKAKPQIARDSRKNIVMSFNQVGKVFPVFADVVAVLDRIQEESLDGKDVKEDDNMSSGELQSLTVLYNKFKSVIAFDITQMKLYPASAIRSSPNLAIFEVNDDALTNFAEFAAASKLFWALAEGFAAEMASKRTAMENASKNAGEVIEKLTMQYNRTRQAVITNDLVDIIVGASAL